MKNLKNLGVALSKTEQKGITGGCKGFSDGECNQVAQNQIVCSSNCDCDLDAYCNSFTGRCQCVV